MVLSPQACDRAEETLCNVVACWELYCMLQMLDAKDMIWQDCIIAWLHIQEQAARWEANKPM